MAMTMLEVGTSPTVNYTFQNLSLSFPLFIAFSARKLVPFFFHQRSWAPIISMQLDRSLNSHSNKQIFWSPKSKREKLDSPHKTY